MLDRRELMLRAAWLLGGAVASSACSGESGPENFSQSGAAPTERQGYFSTARFAVLVRLSDLLIPQTDTPGAIDAGVPEAANAMMQNWASSETKASFDEIIDAVEAKAVAEEGASFVTLPIDRQADVFAEFDALMFKSDENANALQQPYRRFKELLLLAYYYSEPGATLELRLEPVPGPFKGDIPFSEVGRAWAVV